MRSRLVSTLVAASALVAFGGCAMTDDYARSKLIKLEAKVDALQEKVDAMKKSDGPHGTNPPPPGGGGGSLPPPPPK